LSGSQTVGYFLPFRPRRPSARRRSRVSRTTLSGRSERAPKEGLLGRALTLDVGGSAAAEALGDELLAQRLLERAHEGQDDVDPGRR
jgi:hypothetical protein